MVSSLRTSWYDLSERLHRKDGPAFVYSNGAKKWFIHGELHRIDGPAEEFVLPQNKFWFINGINISKQEYKKMLALLNQIRMNNE